MSALFSELGGLTGGAASEALAFAAGFAAARALAPAATTIAQDAWNAAPVKRLDAGTAAEIAAQGVASQSDMADEATYTGIEQSRFESLYRISLAAPGTGELLEMLRRRTITPDEFTHGLRKHKLETRWDSAVRDLQDRKLEPGAIATAIHRGIIAGNGLIIQEPPQTAGRVPHVPQSDIDGRKEAAAFGYDAERLRVLVGNTGLPPGLMEMLNLWNRGVVTKDDVQRAVSQSNLRNEYMDVVLALGRQLPTARDYLENALRGYRTLPDALHGASLHGMTAEDATMIYQNQGRPMNLRLITQALARGGQFKPEPGEITDPYHASIVEGSLKPAYYDLAYANRYTLPGAFAIRALAQAGELSHEETHTLLLQTGWEPGLAAKVATQWSGGGAGKPDPHVVKAQNQLWTTLHKSYVDGETTTAEVAGDLTALGVAPGAHAAVTALWDRERDVVRRSLTPSQIKKAFGDALFTRAEAIARLERQGMNAKDAAVLLDE